MGDGGEGENAMQRWWNTEESGTAGTRFSVISHAPDLAQRRRSCTSMALVGPNELAHVPAQTMVRKQHLRVSLFISLHLYRVNAKQQLNNFSYLFPLKQIFKTRYTEPPPLVYSGQTYDSALL
jgi:hypothetical protein